MRRWQGLLFVYGTIGVMLALSWNQWWDPIVDFGREVYVPWQLSQGKTLYRDIAYFNGPISPHFNAMIFRIFGEGVLTLAIVNAVILAFTLTILHVILTKLSDLTLATILCICLIPLMCIAQPGSMANYNFITPYSHEMTHGLLLSLAAIACLMRMHRVWDSLAGILAGLTTLTKPEIALACCTAVIVDACLTRGRLSVSWIVIMMAITPLTAFIVYGSDAFAAYQHLLDPRITQLRFYKLTMGTFDLSMSLVNIALWSTVWMLILLMGESTVGKLHRNVRLIALVILIVASLWTLDLINWRNVALPLIVFAGWAAWHAFRSREFARFTFCVFAFLLLGKIAFNVSLSNYGFVLALPALCAVVCFLGTWKHGLRTDSFPALRWAAVGMLFVISAVYLAFSLRQWNRAVDAIGNSRGYTALPLDRGATPDMLDSVRLPSAATLAVIPQGAMLNFLTRRENPTPYSILMPPEVLMFGEARIVSAFEARPPEFILFVQTDLNEYGYRSFEDYAPLTTKFLKANYQQIRKGDGFFLLKHNEMP